MFIPFKWGKMYVFTSNKSILLRLCTWFLVFSIILSDIITLNVWLSCRNNSLRNRCCTKWCCQLSSVKCQPCPINQVFTKMKMITAGKRVRAAAFTNDEKIILRDAIRPFSSIILSNKTDSSTVLRKQEAWIAIQYGYNSYANVTQVSGVHLDWSSVMRIANVHCQCCKG